jgi:hypothetical protein
MEHVVSMYYYKNRSGILNGSIPCFFRLIFWDKMETLSGYFLLPLPSSSDASPNKHTTSLRATPFSLPKLMELHTQDPINGDEIRYQYIISTCRFPELTSPFLLMFILLLMITAGDHAEGTKVACKITEDKRMVKNCDRKRSSSSATSTGLVQKTRFRIFELMNKSKINRIAREQKVFLNNFKGTAVYMRIRNDVHLLPCHSLMFNVSFLFFFYADHLKEIAHAPTQLVV